MLQTRAGRCPNCDEQVAPEATTCPNCGRALEWDKTNQEQRRSAARGPSTPARAVAPKKPVASFLRLFILFVVACAATAAAVTFRAKFKTDAPELEAYHSVLVQDAEEFRAQIAANKTNPEFVETTYVIGSAMPNGKDVLEITVRNEWKTLDYPTRLNYAAKFVERWKAIHAPHRANTSILDEGGNEIGGRTWTGTVWVVEKHDAAPRAKPVAPKTKTPDASTPDASTQAAPNATDNAATSANSTANAADDSTADATTNTATNTTTNAVTNSANTPATSSDPNDIKDIEKQ